jgi:predicted O-methyltransferase YrrM
MANPIGALRRQLRIARQQRRARECDRQGRRDEAAVQRARCNEGWFTSSELRLLYRTVQGLRGPGPLAEIGSWKGRSTALMAMALRDRGCEAGKIIAIDPHVGSDEHRGAIEREGPTLREFRRNLARLALDGWIEELVLFSKDAAEVLRRRGAKLRFLLIDGAHDYAAVQQDIRHFLPLMHDDAVIALHDCEPDGVWPEVWQAYQDELAPRVDLIERAHSLTVTRRRAAAA